MNLDDKQVSQVLFHPRREGPSYSKYGIHTQTQCSSAVICGYLHENYEAENLLLFFHGNGEIASDYVPYSSIFTNCGVSFWVVDYRGYGRSSGTPSFSRMLQDAEAILDDIPRISRKIGRTFRSTIVMGRSLGSASAIHLASKSNNKVAGLILDSPFAKAPALIYRLSGLRIHPRDIVDFTDNIDKIDHCTLPTLIIHGTEDRVIPLSEAQALYWASKSTEKEIIEISGAGHNDLFAVGYEEYWRNLKELICLINSRSKPSNRTY